MAQLPGCPTHQLAGGRGIWHIHSTLLIGTWLCFQGLASISKELGLHASHPVGKRRDDRSLNTLPASLEWNYLGLQLLPGLSAMLVGQTPYGVLVLGSKDQQDGESIKENHDPNGNCMKTCGAAWGNVSVGLGLGSCVIPGPCTPQHLLVIPTHSPSRFSIPTAEHWKDGETYGNGGHSAQPLKSST